MVLKLISACIVFATSCQVMAAENGVGGTFSNDSKSGSEKGRSSDVAGGAWGMQALGGSSDPAILRCHKLIGMPLVTSNGAMRWQDRHAYAYQVADRAGTCLMATGMAVSLLLKKHKNVGMIDPFSTAVQASVQQIPFSQLLSDARNTLKPSFESFEEVPSATYVFQLSDGPWRFEQSGAALVMFYKNALWFDQANVVDGVNTKLSQAGSSSNSSGRNTTYQGAIAPRK